MKPAFIINTTLLVFTILSALNANAQFQVRQVVRHDSCMPLIINSPAQERRVDGSAYQKENWYNACQLSNWGGFGGSCQMYPESALSSTSTSLGIDRNWILVASFPGGGGCVVLARDLRDIQNPDADYLSTARAEHINDTTAFKRSSPGGPGAPLPGVKKDRCWNLVIFDWC